MFFMQGHWQRKAVKSRQSSLHKLTPEEKGYLKPYIVEQKNSIYVGVDDGVMSGLRSKGITFLASNMGSMLEGIAYNLQPWAREYLESNPHLLHGALGRPMTPKEKLGFRY